MTNDEAIDLLDNLIGMISDNQDSDYDEALKLGIKALSENKGEWKRTYLDHVAMGERPSILYCSVCHQCIAYPTNFCPNCGAKMKGGE